MSIFIKKRCYAVIIVAVASHAACVHKSPLSSLPCPRQALRNSTNQKTLKPIFWSGNVSP